MFTVFTNDTGRKEIRGDNLNDTLPDNLPNGTTALITEKDAETGKADVHLLIFREEAREWVEVEEEE